MQKPQIPIDEAEKELEGKLKGVKTWTDLYSIGLEYCIDVLPASGGCVEVFEYYMNRAGNSYEKDDVRRSYSFVPVVVDKTCPNEKQGLEYTGGGSTFYRFNVSETEISPDSLAFSNWMSFRNKYTLVPLSITVFIRNVFVEEPGPDRQYLVDMYLDVGDLSKAEKIASGGPVGYPKWAVDGMTRVIALETELEKVNQELCRKRNWEDVCEYHSDPVSIKDCYLERRVQSCLRDVVVKGCKYD